MDANCPNVNNPRLLADLLRLRIVTEDMGIFEAYCTWTKVIDDPVVLQRQNDAPREAIYFAAAPVSFEDTLAEAFTSNISLPGAWGVIRRMTKDELKALRVRIGV
jgi:hypothetical protein